MNLELEDRLYTSTEVANILGVSLRSVYRYLEDSKLVADIKTATGRHRFTKQNIIDFLSPQGSKVSKVKEPEEAKVEVKVVETKPVEKADLQPELEKEREEKPSIPSVEKEKEDVDWLAKFRSAAEKYKQQSDVEKLESEPVVSKVAETFAERKPTETVSGLTESAVEEETVSGVQFRYYKSAVGGLKEIAQSIDKAARKSSLGYAFTSDAGLSLHKPIRPFSTINAYVKPENLDFFERMLELTPIDEGTAQLCLQVSSDDLIYQNRKEMHGLFVVSDDLLKSDLIASGKEDLAKELD